MGRILAGLASTHAVTFLPPSEWDAFRKRIGEAYARRRGCPPTPLPAVEAALAAETLSDNESRYRNIERSIEKLRTYLTATQPDALILVGDDQNENFTGDSVLPQLAIFTGSEFKIPNDSSTTSGAVRAHSALAKSIVQEGVEVGFDIAVAPRLAADTLSSHAHHQIIHHIVAGLDIPVVPIFINALHQPAPTPARCLAFGKMIARAIVRRASDERVVLFGSGGLSHFTGGYPWDAYSGAHQFGSICEAFDRHVIDQLLLGDMKSLSCLSSDELLDNGNIELRSWLVVQGAMAPAPAEWVTYEPFFRGMMGMAVGKWNPHPDPPDT